MLSSGLGGPDLCPVSVWELGGGTHCKQSRLRPLPGPLGGLRPSCGSLVLGWLLAVLWDTEQVMWEVTWEMPTGELSRGCYLVSLRGEPGFDGGGAHARPRDWHFSHSPTHAYLSHFCWSSSRVECLQR